MHIRTFFRINAVRFLLIAGALFSTGCDSAISNWIGKGRGFSPADELKTGPLSITASPTQLLNTTNYQFTASGGTAPYVYSVQSGSGSINSISGLFSSSTSYSGAVVIKVVDSAGASVTATFNSYAPLQFTKSGNVTSLGAPSDQIYPDTHATGGIAPYTYRIASGPGTINASTGKLTLQFSWQSTQVEAQDSIGQTQSVSVGNAPLVTNGFIRDVILDGSDLFIAGDFSRVYPKVVSGLAQVNVADGLVSSQDCNPEKRFNHDAIVNDLQIDGDAVYIGGSLTSYDGVAIQNIAKISLSTCALDTTFSQTTGFNNVVNTIELNGSNLYVGGLFTEYRGVTSNRIAKIDKASGNQIAAFDSSVGFDSWVASIKFDGTSIYVGGGFTTYRGSIAKALAKLDSTTGVLDTTFTQTTGFTYTFGAAQINSVLVIGSSVYVGGRLETYRATSGLGDFAKVDKTSGNLDAAFSATGFSGGSHIVNSMTTDGIGNIYVTGEFDDYKGATAPQVAKIDATTGALNTSFNLNTGGLTGSGACQSVAVHGTWVYVACRNMLNYRLTPIENFVRLDATSGNLDASFGTAIGNSTGFQIKVMKIIDSNRFFFGGNFSFLGGTPLKGLAKISKLTGAVDSTFHSVTGLSLTTGSPSAYRLLMIGSDLYVAGLFDSYRGTTVQNLIKVNKTSGVLDTTFSSTTGPNSLVYDMLDLGGFLYISGAFTTYRGSNARYIAKVNPTSGALDTTFTQATGFNSTARAIATDGTSIFAAGSFTLYRGATSQRVAKLDTTNGNLDGTFGLATGFDSTVSDLVVASGSLYVAGYFTTYRSTAAPYLAKIDLANGNLDTTFTQPAQSDTFIESLAVNGTALYASGGVTNYRGTTVQSMIKVDLTSGNLDTTFSQALGFKTGGASGLRIFSSVLFCVGAFSSYRDSQSPYFIPLSLTSGNLVSF